MLSYLLDPDLEYLLEHDVDDLARYNILRYLHDHQGVRGDVQFFAEELGLRSQDRAREALEALCRCGLLEKTGWDGSCGETYALSPDLPKRDIVDRLYQLSSTSWYSEIVEQLAARSLRRARKAQAAAESGRRGHSKTR